MRPALLRVGDYFARIERSTGADHELGMPASPELAGVDERAPAERVRAEGFVDVAREACEGLMGLDCLADPPTPHMLP